MRPSSCESRPVAREPLTARGQNYSIAAYSSRRGQGVLLASIARRSSQPAAVQSEHMLHLEPLDWIGHHSEMHHAVTKRGKGMDMLRPADYILDIYWFASCDLFAAGIGIQVPRIIPQESLAGGCIH